MPVLEEQPIIPILSFQDTIKRDLMSKTLFYDFWKSVPFSYLRNFMSVCMENKSALTFDKELKIKMSVYSFIGEAKS